MNRNLPLLLLLKEILDLLGMYLASESKGLIGDLKVICF